MDTTPCPKCGSSQHVKLTGTYFNGKANVDQFKCIACPKLWSGERPNKSKLVKYTEKPDLWWEDLPRQERSPSVIPNNDT